MAQEARDVGLHHEGFLGDKGTVEVADFKVVGKSHAAEAPAGEKLGNTEAVDGGTCGVGAEVGNEEGQGAKIGTHLHRLVLTAVAVAYAAHSSNNLLDRVAGHVGNIFGGDALTRFGSTNLDDGDFLIHDGHLI